MTRLFLKHLSFSFRLLKKMQSQDNYFKKAPALFLVVLQLFELASSKYINDSEVTLLLTTMLRDYDRRLRPNYTGSPLHVGVDLSILRFGKVDALKMKFEVDMFFRQEWHDHRLRHNLGRTMTITVGNKHPADIVWVPDTVFINSVTSSMHDVTVQNHKLDIYENGKVFWGTRVTVSPSCRLDHKSYPMDPQTCNAFTLELADPRQIGSSVRVTVSPSCRLDLRSYPMDTQTCNFEIVSYAHSAKDLIYDWKSRPGIVISDKQMAQFEMTGFTTKGELLSFVAGSYSLLTATFTFKRLMGHALLQIFIPCFFIVCVSWISLWIKRNAVPARVGLCITTLLTVATIWGGANSSLPRVNYVKAVDVYLMTSFCFVLCTLIEYVLVLNCENVRVNCRKRKHTDDRNGAEEVLLQSAKPAVGRLATACPNMASNGNGNWTPKLTDNRRVVRATHYSNGFPILTNLLSPKKTREYRKVSAAFIIENSARVLFPLAFVSFNCAYWLRYLHSK